MAGEITHMGTRSLLINCGCKHKLCHKAVRLSGKTGGGPVKLTIYDGARTMGTITLLPERAPTIVQWLLVVPAQAQQVAWKLLAELNK